MIPMTNAHTARSVTGVLWMVSKSDEGQLLQLIKVDLRNAREGAPAQELDDRLVGHESRHFGEVATSDSGEGRRFSCCKELR